MFSIQLRRAAHSRHYSIQATHGTGWEVKLLEDRVLTRCTRYDDWHRVERVLALFRREVADLSADGWETMPAAGSE